MRALTRGCTWLVLLCVMFAMGSILIGLPVFTATKSLKEALEVTSILLSASIKVGLFALFLALLTHHMDERNEKTKT